MRRFLAIALLLVSLSGCTDSTSAPANNPAANNANAPASTATDLAANNNSAADKPDSSNNLINEVEISLADLAKVESAVQSYTGRVVVLDVWSTSCVPCMKEFPHLVELAKRWPEDLVCISLNVDYIGLPNKPPKDCIPRAKEFLVSVAADPANLMNLVCSESDETVFSKFEIEALPAILVYDRQSKLAKKVTVDSAGDDGLSYAGDVVPLVEQLIESR